MEKVEDKKIQKMPFEENEEGESGSWFSRNRSLVVAVIIIIILVGGIYALSKKENTAEQNTEENTAQVTGEGNAEQGQEQASGQEAANTQGAQTATVSVQGEVRGNEIVESAQKGQGVTHLARKALGLYLTQVDSSEKLSNEQKIYIEDYLKDKTGRQPLRVGESKSFSKDLIKEAIGASKQLNEKQLQNLKKYSKLVFPEQV